MTISSPQSAQDLDAFLVRWAKDCLGEAIQNGRTSEVPYYARALQHVCSEPAGGPKAVVIGIRPKTSSKLCAAA